MNEITAYLIQASLDVYGQNFKQAFTAMNAAVGAFHRFFADQKEQNWTLPILYQMLLDLQGVQQFWCDYLKLVILGDLARNFQNFDFSAENYSENRQN